MKINLGSIKIIEIVEKKSQTVETDTVTVHSITDNPGDKVVSTKIIIGLNTKIIVLWESTDYDNIGDWTKNQVSDKIIEILSN